ncbi:MAG: glycosyltransferase family 1 protein [Planctomycetota bacterium]
MTARLRIVVTGLIGQYPLGGVTWDYLQYPVGLARLGHDVYYIEDTGQWPYTPAENGLAKNCDYTVEHLSAVFDRFGLEGRWAYKFPWQSQWFGLPEARRKDIIDTADLLINVSGTLERPEDYRGAGVMAYIDSDPVFTQVKIASGNDYFRKLIEQHDVLFSFGEHHSANTPHTGHEWLPTRQPILLDEWRPQPSHRDVFTTVMNWSAYKPIRFEGKAYGQKDIEFKRYVDLPELVAPTVLELAAAQGKDQKLPRELLVHKGWKLVDPSQVCPDLDTYRAYIQSSKAEWSVAKNGYVAGQSGWFSCRSACYLAAGRPVVVQETGFSSVLPVGEGILSFTTPEQAREDIRRVEADHERHCRAARAIAEEYFDSDKVLTQLVERAMEVSV